MTITPVTHYLVPGTHFKLWVELRPSVLDVPLSLSSSMSESDKSMGKSMPSLSLQPSSPLAMVYVDGAHMTCSARLSTGRHPCHGTSSLSPATAQHSTGKQTLGQLQAPQTLRSCTQGIQAFSCPNSPLFNTAVHRLAEKIKEKPDPRSTSLPEEAK